MAKKLDPETLFEDAAERETQGPVECLGMTFENDEARRAYFLHKLREKLKDPEFRKIEGFPIGDDEDILALSDPPYYTACPNPFLGDVIKHYGKPYDPDTDDYRREPFAADVSEGKNDPIYSAHSYHTKVPPKAIMRYILHYTRPGDLVFDGFCGTGMTAVAAQMCGNPALVESLGALSSGVSSGRTIEIGPRAALVADLSPIATFIAHNLLLPTDVPEFLEQADSVADHVASDLPWLYETHDAANRRPGTLIYAVWSDFLLCSECSAEIDAWDVVVDHKNKIMHGEFNCPTCKSLLKRRCLDKVVTTLIDPVSREPRKQTKQSLKLVHYRVGSLRQVRSSRADDYQSTHRALQELQRLPIPTCSFESSWRHYRDGNHLRNITHSHHYYTPRNLLCLTTLLRYIGESRLPHQLLFVLTGFVEGHANRRNRYIVDRHHPEGTTCGPLSNTLFVPEVQCEVNILDKWRQTVKKQAKAKAIRLSRRVGIQTCSATRTSLPDNCIDYMFIDPPFGKNIMYSDLNLLWETWLRVFTQHEEEAVVNDLQKKGLTEYGGLMSACFREFFRILKPGRWITLEFHNSRNAVWVAIQEALTSTGFIVADVRVLDKKHGTLHQDSGYTVKKDLIVSAYKANDGLESRFKLEAGTEEGVWDFIRTHLKQLPVFVSQDGQTEVLTERQDFLLFDRMVAFHVQRNVTVPLPASEFRVGLAQRFPERDGMYFLPEQVAEYDKKRMTVKEVFQLQLFVTDEASAIQWLKQQLTKKPQTFQEIHPQFLKEIGGWNKNEKPLELSELLEQNFLRCDGQGEVPSQIHSYLSTNFKEMRKKPKDDPSLRAKGKDRWYVPDPNKAGDLEKLRERALLREFWEYLPAGYKPAKPESQEGFIPGLEPKPAPIPKGKKMKVIRLEAVRAGFKQCWQDRDYRTIIAVAQRIPENVLQEDPKLLMWYDQALTRTGGD